MHGGEPVKARRVLPVLRLLGLALSRRFSTLNPAT